MKKELNKKTKYLIIGIVLLLIIASIIIIKIFHNPKEEPKKNENTTIKENITPLMYEITKNGSNNKIYLFGSIHIANTNKLNFPDYVNNAFNQSNYIACEFDLIEFQKDQNKVMQMMQDMLYQDGSTIKDHLSTNTYNKLVNFLKEKEMYSEIYDIYKPIFFESLITNIMANDTKIATNDGIDAYFLNKAKKEGKKILEIESADYQTNLLSNFSDKLYELMLVDLIDNYDQEVKSLMDLYEAWKKGDIERILNESSDELEIKSNYTKEEINLIKEYNKDLIDNRNIDMTNKLIEYFNNNYDTFYMVGAAHLVGDKGIAHLLETKGYTVKQISN